LEGRREFVIKLQRHPLIYPIFRPHPYPLLEGKGKSLARPSRDGTFTS